jgi:hypothetical protein
MKLMSDVDTSHTSLGSTQLSGCAELYVLLFGAWCDFAMDNSGDANFLSSSDDESWIYGYYPQTKQQTSQCKSLNL